MIIVCISNVVVAQDNGELGKKEMGQTIHTEKEARKIAESCFLEVTNQKINKYEILLQEEQKHWVYFIKGKEEFERPGYHWIVEVNKFTGKPEIFEGE